MDKADINHLTELLGYRFNNLSLLERSLTHRSAATVHNETLEFLGDSVLSAVVSDYLFKTYPESTEGELTRMRARIVNNNVALFQVAEHLGFYHYIIVDRGFVKSNRKAWQNLLANTLEALLGAIYLDGGYEAAAKFFDQHFAPLLEELNSACRTNFKSVLQEFLQGRAEDIPQYETVDKRGECHLPEFTVACSVGLLESPVLAKGKTVKEAEQIAARRVYELLLERNS